MNWSARRIYLFSSSLFSFFLSPLSFTSSFSSCHILLIPFLFQEAAALKARQHAEEVEQQRSRAEDEAAARRLQAAEAAAEQRRRDEDEAREERRRRAAEAERAEEEQRQRREQEEALERQRRDEAEQQARRNKDALLAKMRAIDGGSQNPASSPPATQLPSAPASLPQEQLWKPAAPPVLEAMLTPTTASASVAGSKGDTLPWLADGPKKSKVPAPAGGSVFSNMHLGLTSDGRRIGSGHASGSEDHVNGVSPAAGRRVVSGRRDVDSACSVGTTAKESRTASGKSIKKLPIPPISGADPSRPLLLEASEAASAPGGNNSTSENSGNGNADATGTDSSKVLSPRSSSTSLPWETKVNLSRTTNTEPRAEPAADLPTFKRASNVHRNGRGRVGPGASTLSGLQPRRPKRKQALANMTTVDPEDDGLEAIAI